MPDDGSTAESVPLAAWLENVHLILGPSSGPGLTSADQAALLDLARIAAHRCERIAAPLTTFLAGVAYGGLSSSERATALQSLVSRIEG